MRNAVAIVAILTSVSVLAQNSPPATDIFLVGLDGVTVVGEPSNVTARDGYDNQPYFLPDSSGFLYTSLREDGQTDIFRYDLESEVSSPVTRTPEGEYSPTPFREGRAFSVIRVEADGTQRLWAFAMDGTSPELILENVKPVGYHAWSGDELQLALFVLGDPPTLQLADVSSGTAETVTSNIGRSLHKRPDRDAFTYVDKSDDKDWWIEQLDLSTMSARPIAPTLEESEDYVWTPEGEILMAQQSSLFRWDPSASDWAKIADWSAARVDNITRLAVSPSGKYLAFVADAAPSR